MQHQKLSVQLRNADKKANEQRPLNEQVQNMSKGSGTVSPNLQLIQQKAAKLLLGSNNNNSLFEISHLSKVSPMNLTQNFGSPFQKQAQLKKNQDILDAFEDSRIERKSKVQQTSKELNQSHMFTIKSKKNGLLSGPGSRYNSKNTTSNDGFFQPLSTKSVGFSMGHQILFNKTQTAQISARSSQRRRVFNDERVGITGFNLQNQTKKMQGGRQQFTKMQQASKDMSVGIQQMSKSFMQNDGGLMSVTEGTKRLRYRKSQVGSISSKQSKLNQSQHGCPPIRNPMSPMSHQFQGKKVGVMSLNSENVLQNWQSSELPPFIGARQSTNTYQAQGPTHGGTASRLGRQKLNPEQSKRNIFSAEPNMNASGEQTLNDSSVNFRMNRDRINLKPINESSIQMPQTQRQVMSHKFPQNNSLGRTFSPNNSKFASFSKNQYSEEETPFDSVQFLSSPQDSYRIQPVHRNPAQTRKFMQKFDDLTQETVLQNVFIKLWKMLLKTQYAWQFEKANPDSKLNSYKKPKTKKAKQMLDLKKKNEQEEIERDPLKKITFQSNIPTLPLDLSIYLQCIPQFKKALGAMFDTDEFVAKSPTYINSHVFFDRFCYDMVSLLGENAFKLNVLDIEYIFRTTYLTLSHSFGPQEGGVKLLDLNSIIESPFSAEALQDLNKRMVFEQDEDVQIRVSPPPLQTKERLQSSAKSGRKRNSQVSSTARSPKIRIQPKNSLPEWSTKKEKPKGFFHGNSKRPSRQQSPSLQRPSALKKFGKNAKTNPGDVAFGAVSEREGSFFLQDDLESNEHPQSTSKKSAQNTRNPKRKVVGGTNSVKKEEREQDQIPHSSMESRFRGTTYIDGALASSLGIDSPQERSTQQSPVASPPSESNNQGATLEDDVEQMNSIETGEDSKMSLAQIVARRAQEKADRAALKQKKVSAIQERERTAVFFQPKDGKGQNQYSNIMSQIISEEDPSQSVIDMNPLITPIQNPSLHQKEQDYRILQQLKSKKRSNFDSFKNGSLRPIQRRPTDGSLQQDSLIGNSIDSQASHNLQEKKIIKGNKQRAAPLNNNIGREQQLDILEGFEKYDEAFFKSGMNDIVLNQGLNSKNLLPTELNLLQSNRIDRKTILLNHMQMFDQATKGIPNKDANQQKQQNIVRKLGVEHVNTLTDNSTSEGFDNAQPSLDQYDQLNKTSQAGSTTGLVQIQKTNQGEQTTNSLDQHLPTHYSGDSQASSRENSHRGQQMSGQSHLKNNKCNIDQIMRESEKINSGLSGSQVFSQQYDRQPRLPNHIRDQDPMMINPLTQATQSQADMQQYHSVSQNAEEQYVLIDEQGNIRQNPQNIDATFKKKGAGQPQRTKFIMQLDPTANKKIRDQGAATQTSVGFFESDQFVNHSFENRRIPTLKISDNNTVMKNLDEEFADKNLNELVPLPSVPTKLTYQSAQFSNGQFSKALKASRGDSSGEALLMDESQGGGDIVDNESTNEGVQNQRNQNSNSKDRSNAQNVTIQGPKMISIEYDRHESGNFIQSSVNEVGTITTQQAQFDSFDQMDNKSGERTQGLAQKSVVVSQNKTNFALMHKKNKEFKKKNAQANAEKKQVISHQKIESIMKNRKKDGLKSKESKVRSPEENQRAINQLQIKAFQELYSVESDTNFKKINVMNSVQVLPQQQQNKKTKFVSIGVQNTSGMIKTELGQSDQDQNSRIQQQTMLRKITTHDVDQYGFGDHQSNQMQAASVSAKPPFRVNTNDLASQSNDEFEIAKTDTFNAIQTLDKETIRESHLNQLTFVNQNESQQNHNQQNQAFYNNLPPDIKGSDKKGKTNAFISSQVPHKVQFSPSSTLHPAKQSVVSPNTTQISFNEGFVKQLGVTKDLHYRMAKKEREQRIRKRSPRVYQQQANVQELTLGIQHRKLNANVERSTGSPPRKLSPKTKVSAQNTSDALFQESFGANGVPKKKGQSPMGKVKAERQVIIPIAAAQFGTGSSIGDTPFMRNNHQHSVGNSINSGTSINEEDSVENQSSLQMNTTQSVSHQNRMRYQIIHKNSSINRRPGKNEKMLESIQTSKLLNSSIITGHIGDKDSSPGILEANGAQEDARVTANISDEIIDDNTPKENPLLLLGSNDISQNPSKDHIIEQREKPDITSGSRYIVEFNDPTEPNERIQKDKIDKIIREVLINQPDEGTNNQSEKQITQNLSSNNNSPGILNILQSKKMRGPAHFKNMENHDLDQVNTSHHNRNQQKFSVVHQKRQNSMRHPAVISSNPSKDAKFVDLSQANRVQQPMKQQELNITENRQSSNLKTHTHLKIKELKIINPLAASESLNSTPGLKGQKLVDTPSNKFKKAQIKALNLDALAKQMESTKEPVLILHGQSPKMLPQNSQAPFSSKSPKSKNESRSKTHVVEVNFKNSQLKKDESELVEHVATDHDANLRKSEVFDQSPRIGRQVIKSYDSKKDFKHQTQSPIDRFSITNSEANPSFSVFGAGQVPQSMERRSQGSLRSSEKYYQSYNEYIQQLNELQEQNQNRTSPNFLVNPSYNPDNFKHQQTRISDLQQLSARSMKNKYLGKVPHHSNCTRICCIQNAISNQIQLAQKKENVKRMKEGSIYQQGLQSMDGTASLGAIRKGPVTELAVLSFSDHNLQSWRQIDKSKR